jgi:hypothetical protein
MQQKLRLSPHFSFLQHQCIALPFFSFAMNVNPNMVAPFASKSLGDLSKNNPAW